MRLTILTLAHHAYTSDPGNLLNLTGVFTGLTSPTFPFVVPRLLLVARFTGSPVDYAREFEVMVSFVDEDGLPGPIPGDRRRMRMTAGQSGEDVHAVYLLESVDTTFAKPGWYQFFVHVDGASTDELPVHISRSARRNLV